MKLMKFKSSFSIVLLSLKIQTSFSLTSLNSNPNQRYNHELCGITKSKVAVLDGSSFNALDAFLLAEGIRKKDSSNRNDSLNRYGFCSVVTAKLNNERVVGIRVESYHDSDLENVEIGDGVKIYKDSLATIPQSLSDEDAISTFVASLAGIHCSYYDPVSPDGTIITNIGGSSEIFLSAGDSTKDLNKKAVVVGGGDYASFVADGLAAIGATVTQVTTNKLMKPRKQGNVSISPPDVGELGIGFASAIGKFDVLVDTLSDEGRAGESMCIGIDNDWDDFSTESGEECSSAVILDLKKRHNCQRYISTMCKAQKMVRDNGLLFGRNDAVKYTKEVGNNANKNNAQFILPPKQFGTKTIQKLLDAKILLKSKGNEQSWTQGWSMKDYWELTTWPRDTAGAANVRFGFPVVDDIDFLSNAYDDDLEINEQKAPMVSAPPKRTDIPSPPKTPKDDFAGKTNPFISEIKGVDDLSSEILGEKKQCVLFLSSASCRTCKYLTPQYTKLSRDFSDSEVVFAKLNAFSKKGKELSKVLEVDAVPAFVLFRDGKRFGNTLSITRIPSKKLDLALELLQDGEWDAKRMSKLNR